MLRDNSHGAYLSTEIFDPASGSFTSMGNMHNARYKHTGTSLLPDDWRVLLVGGAASTEIFDPKQGTFQKVAEYGGVVRLFATATLLPNGEVLFAGSYGPDIFASPQAWVLKF